MANENMNQVLGQLVGQIDVSHTVVLIDDATFVVNRLTIGAKTRFVAVRQFFDPHRWYAPVAAVFYRPDLFACAFREQR